MEHPHRIVRTAEIMGTVMSVHVLVRAANPGASGGSNGGASEPSPSVVAVVDAAAESCFADLRADDALFSPFRSDSEVSRIVVGLSLLADASPRVREVADACLAAEEETRGRFSAFWSGRFDPTGYVKGWSVEAAARRWLEPLVRGGNGDGGSGSAGVPGSAGTVIAAGINAGGDLQLFTADSADWEWTVGIADPRPATDLSAASDGPEPPTPTDAPAVIATVRVRNGAVATSGSAERGTHIRDPRTGFAAAGAIGATVVDDSLTRADLWATTAVVAGADDLSWMPASGTRSGLVVADGDRVRRWANGVEVVAAQTFTIGIS